jgi:predicted transcriptional regulator YheO
MTFRSSLKKKLARIGVKALKMKPDSVAKKLGISRATVYRYLKGR